MSKVINFFHGHKTRFSYLYGVPLGIFDNHACYDCVINNGVGDGGGSVDYGIALL